MPDKGFTSEIAQRTLSDFRRKPFEDYQPF
jgi:hypothetical protein